MTPVSWYRWCRRTRLEGRHEASESGLNDFFHRSNRTEVKVEDLGADNHGGGQFLGYNERYAQVSVSQPKAEKDHV